MNKNIVNLKTTSATNQTTKSEKDKERNKINDLLRQRASLEMQVSKYKSDMFAKDRELLDHKKEIEKLNKQLAEQKAQCEIHKSNVEKYKDLYTNAKSAATPFTDSRMDNLTEATLAKKTPTDMKFNSLLKQTPTPHVPDIKEAEKKLEESVDEISEPAKTPTPVPPTPPEEASQKSISKNSLKSQDQKSSKSSEDSVEEQKESYRETSQDYEETGAREGEDTGEGEEVDEQFKQEIRFNITNIISMASEQAEREEKMQQEDEDEGDTDKGGDGTESKLDTEHKEEVEEEIKGEGIREEVNEEVQEEDNQQVEEEVQEDVREEVEEEVKEEDKEEVHEVEEKELEPIETPKQTKHDLADSSRIEGQSDNRLESSETEIVEELTKPKDIFKSRVSIVDIPKLVKTEFRLILQNQKIPFSKLQRIFPPTKRIGLQQLIDHFKSFNRFDNDVIVEQVCRYLVENDANGDIIHYDKNADMDKIAIGT